MPTTTIASMTVGQAIAGSIATSAASALLGKMLAPKAPKPAELPPGETKPELAALPDRENVQRAAELTAAKRASKSGRQSTVFSDDDLLGA